MKDNKVIKAVEEMKQARVKMLRDEEWREVDNIIYKKEKVYIPRDEKLKAEIIQLYHNTPVKEHQGQQKMVELVTRNFWWLGVTKKVKQYMEGCNTCQHNKNCTEQLAEKLMPNSIPEKPQVYISADFITKLLLAQQYNSILVIVKKLTKIVHFIPTTEKMSVKGLARLFRDNMRKLHGLSKSIISDRESQFIVGIMQELNRMLETKSKLLAVFHPQTDGQLGTVQFVYNNKVHSSTKTLPFKANYGQDPRIGFETRRKGKYKRAEKFMTKMKEIQKEAKVVLEKV